MRIVDVARDATFQRMLGGAEHAASVIRRRGGHAFDPDIVAAFGTDTAALFAIDAASAWDETLASEPGPFRVLEGEAIDRALTAMGDFSDLVSPYFAGHASGVATLATRAAAQCRLGPSDLATIRRAALIHDIGRVAVPARIWQQRAPLTPDDWERARLHPYHTKLGAPPRPVSGPAGQGRRYPPRALRRLGVSPWDHRRRADTVGPPARRRRYVSDEDRAQAAPGAAHPGAGRRGAHRRGPGRPPRRRRRRGGARGRRPAGSANRTPGRADAARNRGHRPPARGLQTKQIARALGISVKTADHHIQHAYSKMGVSTRAAAALFAMQHGLVR